MLGRRIKQPKQITGAQSRTQMRLFLYGCRPFVLNAITPEKLKGTYRGVTLKEAEYELLIARQKRADEL